MKIGFPSPQFDEAVAAICHGAVSEGQAKGLNELLLNDPRARDEYLLRVEVHSRLASDPDLFGAIETTANIAPFQDSRGGRNRFAWALAAAACFALLGFGLLRLWPTPPSERRPATSKAVAMLNATVNARWKSPAEMPQSGAPLEPGWLKLDSGLAEIVFYSGARVVIEGPAEFQITSANEAFLAAGTISAEAPMAARGFQIKTPRGTFREPDTSYGLMVDHEATELHVFKGNVKVRAEFAAAEQEVHEGFGWAIQGLAGSRSIAADRSLFASLFEMRRKSMAAEALRFDRWQAASKRLNENPSLLARFDLEGANALHWQLANACKHRSAMPDATIVGCQWVEGRWPNKRALEFQSMNDRVRMSVPGAFESLTFTAWIRVQGLDRKLNSLFMSDGFMPGTVHWLIRRDGALGMTVIGADPKNYRIIASPSAINLEQFGLWLHLAVVIDGSNKRVTHYLNGSPLCEERLDVEGPFHVGDAELGNWNGKGFPGDDPFMIRNFSGAMDEFCIFNRPLSASEVQRLYSEGRPESGSVASR